jgi:hypothetical protein
VAALLPETEGRGAPRPALPAAAIEAPPDRIGKAKQKDAALAGLERWKARYPEAAKHLEPADILVDALRGRHRTWTRIRINLKNVPPGLRPAQEALDPDEKLEDDWIRPSKKSPPADTT